jgi:gliding motility-associated-like protein
VFTPKILDPATGTAYCEDGVDTMITIWINPTPRVIALPDEERICNNFTTNIWLITPTMVTDGLVTFDYVAVPSGNPGDITGFTPVATGLTDGTAINDQLTNHTTDLQTVTYTITPRSLATGCADGLPVQVVVTVHPDPIDSIAILSNVSCYGFKDGALEMVTASWTDSDNFDIIWNGPNFFTSTDRIITGLQSGNYIARVTDSLGCIGYDNEFINSPADIPFNAISPKKSPLNMYNVSCAGASDGDISVLVLGGLYPPFNWWIINEFGDTISSSFTHPGGPMVNLDPRTVNGLPAGFYRAIVEDSEGCPRELELILTEPPEISFDLIPEIKTAPYHISCNGYADGNIQLTNLTGGNGTYSFMWSTSDGSGLDPTAQDQAGLTAGRYVVDVTDVLGCSRIDSVDILEPDGIELVDTIISLSNDGQFNISCAGGNDGSIELILSGGSGGYYFSWSTYDGSGLVPDQQNQTGLTAGTYDVDVWDEEDCHKYYSFTLSEPTPLSMSETLSLSLDGNTNINCNGGSDGYIQLAISGGSIDNYTYEWSASGGGSGFVQGNRDQTGLTAGDYHVVVTDLNGCIIEDDFTLTEPEPLITEMSATQITCASSGYDDGSAEVMVSGGTGLGTYSYLWSNGATTTLIENLTAGWYVVTVTDANDCIIKDSVQIVNPPPLVIGITISDFNGFNISCNGLSDGWIQAEILSGTPEYTFTWSGDGGFSSDSQNINNLTAGQYQLHVEDANECSGDTTVILNEPEPLNISVTTSSDISGAYQMDCYGDADGTISLTISEGAGGYQVEWDDGASGADRTGLTEGWYYATVLDANGCSEEVDVLLDAPEPITIESIVKDAFCPERPDGEINLIVNGGVGGYSYYWSTLSTSNPLTGVPSGEYTVEVMDMNNCMAFDTIIVGSRRSQCLTIPTGFSPNNDGFNDVWIIGFVEEPGDDPTELLGELYPEAVVEIYNRWGEMVFRSERGYPKPWNGSYKGRSLPVDSYHYVIDLNNGSKPIVGNVTIVK